MQQSCVILLGILVLWIVGITTLLEGQARNVTQVRKKGRKEGKKRKDKEIENETEQPCGAPGGRSLSVIPSLVFIGNR